MDNFHKIRKQKNQRRVQQIRQVANDFLDLQRLEKLDYGDQVLVEGMLDTIYHDLHRVRVIADAGCSQVIECLENLGGDVSAPE